MDKIQKIHCPNCGQSALRRYYDRHRMVETACPSCDYLLVSCSITGKVLESYAPGLRMVPR